MKIVSAETDFCKARKLMEQMIEFVQQASAEGLRADQVERELFASLLRAGQALLSGFVRQAGNGDEGRTVERGEQTLQRSESTKTRPYRSIFGVIDVERYVYAVREKQKAEYLPVDQALGLPQGEHSYVLEDWLERFCVKEAFTSSVNSLADLLHCSVSTRSAERINRDMSKYVEPFRLQTQVAPAQPDPDKILVVSADGKGVVMRRPIEERVPENLLRPWRKHHRRQQLARQADRTDKRLGRGEKSGQKQMAYVGAVYQISPWRRTTDEVIDETLRRTHAEERPRPEYKRVWAEMTTYHENEVHEGQPRLFAGLAQELAQRDPAHEQTVVCLMDGQRSLWGMQEEWLARAVPVLDIYHVLERLWKAAYCFHQDGSRDAEDFVTHYLRMLLDGKVGYVVGSFRRLSHQLAGSQKRDLRKIIQFFCNNRDYMHYDVYLGQGYPIGSGVVEGTCRHLVRDRMERTGMHWELEGAQAMLNTRAVFLSGQWDAFIEYRIQKEQTALYALPA